MDQIGLNVFCDFMLNVFANFACIDIHEGIFGTQFFPIASYFKQINI
jgi:hypothetical protein